MNIHELIQESGMFFDSLPVRDRKEIDRVFQSHGGEAAKRAFEKNAYFIAIQAGKTLQPHTRPDKRNAALRRARDSIRALGEYPDLLADLQNGWTAAAPLIVERVPATEARAATFRKCSFVDILDLALATIEDAAGTPTLQGAPKTATPRREIVRLLAAAWTRSTGRRPSLTMGSGFLNVAPRIWPLIAGESVGGEAMREDLRELRREEKN